MTMTDLSDPTVRVESHLHVLRRRLIRLIVSDITRDVLRRRRLGWRA